MEIKTINKVSDILQTWGLTGNTLEVLRIASDVIIIILIASIADFIARKVLLQVFKKMAMRTKSTWDDVLLEKKVFNRIVHIIPALIIYYSIVLVLANPVYETALNLILIAIKIYLVIIIMLAIDSIINSFYTIYNSLEVSKTRPIKGYVQVVKIIVYAVTIIFIISVLRNKPPDKILAGLGAMAAVIMLVFKDTILGFVASIQLSANDMVRPGDWISMPSHGADGDVIDITLNTVKVQNWDKTISTIPTYALVSESFSNWRGMEESGGRRIKRHILIDMKTVKFCTAEMIEKFRKIQRLKEYIEKKEKELKEFNEKNRIDNSVTVNGRRMTNIGIFRAYLEEYLKHHPKIHKEMTMLVRQLQPTQNGIPIEIYVFSNDQAWVNYEAVQSDIFDHILAIIPEFELSVFQSPSGEDFKKLV
ncbi:MAG: mechanosensitive ion channel [Bacteroidales bacterium]|nr:mechanosensitive ion channel [Bacteroidales bacterium]MBN2819975.1 mechanosensitive ion channel [Bacteroidales bacterium]